MGNPDFGHRKVGCIGVLVHIEVPVLDSPRTALAAAAVVLRIVAAHRSLVRHTAVAEVAADIRAEVLKDMGLPRRRAEARRSEPFSRPEALCRLLRDQEGAGGVGELKIAIVKCKQESE